VLDKGPDLLPVAVRNCDAITVEFLVDLLEQVALFSPAFDDVHLSFFDDLSSGLLPGFGGMFHAFAIVVPHNSLCDDVRNSRNNVGMSIETILPE
jgi:hypothetical protein